MTDSLDRLTPTPIWRAFADLCRIPRPSGDLDRVRTHLRQWAEARGLSHRTDGAGNLVVRVPATAGAEDAPPLVLQAHVDMVAEQRPGIAHDWHRDPIQPRIEGDWVVAHDTTLGADNGIGVAMMQAIVDDPPSAHPPLELLFTADEEIGLLGASALESELVSGRRMINLDGEEDGVLYVGCAGGLGLAVHAGVRRDPDRDGELWRLAVGGLRGGHSGVDIHRPHRNAIQVVARLLGAAERAGLAPALVGFEGGDKGNAIARDARADVLIAAQRRTRFAEWLMAECAADESRSRAVEPSIAWTIVGPPKAGAVRAAPLHSVDQDRLLGFLNAVVHGVRAVSAVVPGAIETSCNLASVRLAQNRATTMIGIRSASEDALASTAEGIEALAQLAGCDVERLGGYPPWPAAPEVAVVQQTAEVHERLFGVRPRLEAVHAGLECGVLARRLPGLEAVSFGPQIEGPHAPGERVRIGAVADADRLLRAMLASLVPQSG